MIQSVDAWLLGFKAERIQSWLLAGNRLQDIMGGSELIESLTKEAIERVLSRAGVSGQAKILSGAAGSARIWCANREVGQQLLRVWPLLMDEIVPGLRVSVALVPEIAADGDLREAEERLRAALEADRQAPWPELPELGPLIGYAPRTGQPAVRKMRLGPGRDEFVDRATLAKRQAARRIQREVRNRNSRFDEKLLPETLRADHVFERGADEREEELPMALIHADGNRVGQLIRRLRDRVKEQGRDPSEAFRQLSQGLSEVTEKATCEAIQEVLVPAARWLAVSEAFVIPARPIVLGGDDITILVRADLAVRFTEC